MNAEIGVTMEWRGLKTEELVRTKLESFFVVVQPLAENRDNTNRPKERDEGQNVHESLFTDDVPR